MSVVVIGSINRDVVCRVAALPRPGETVRAIAKRELPGGKGANQAVAAARMAAAPALRVAMIGCIGDDGAGVRQRAALTAAGVDTAGVTVVPGAATGTAYIAIDAAGENQIIVDPGANHALTTAMIPPAAIAAARVVVTQLETPLAVAERAFKLAAAAGAVRLLNTAPALAEAAALFALADVIVLNQTELALYLGRTGKALGRADAPAARTLLSRAGQSAVVTLGAAGALLVDHASECFVPALPVDAVDTTGAGDCFCGALAALIAEGMALDDALPLAGAAAALCVEREGAAAAMPTRAEVAARAADSSATV